MTSSPDPFRIATRASDLALRQTQLVADTLRRCHPGLVVELVPIVTRGDRTKGPLADAGGKGLFTLELEDALRAGRVHAAVHSAKDLPADLPADLALTAMVRRGDPRDALVFAGAADGGWAVLPDGATVGTSSPRRAGQVRTLRPDAVTVGIRGNVETRLLRAVGPEADLDAVVLAMAGLERSGLLGRYEKEILPVEVADSIPAAGQGTLVVQCLAGGEAEDWVRPLDHADTRSALEAEREVLAELEADCHSCVGVYVDKVDRGWRAHLLLGRPDGTALRRAERTGVDARAAAKAVLQALR